MLITQLLSQTATKNMARPAYRYLDKETSFSELKNRIARLSYLFQNELGQHARVAFLTRNSPAFLTTFFALANTRSLTIPIDPDKSPEEIISWLKESGATHLAVTSDLLGKAREILSSARMSLPVIEIEKKQGGEYDTAFTAPPDNQPVETDVILLLRTAGTTGAPKFVSFTHKQIHHAATALRGLYHINVTDRFWTKLSWAHPFSLLHGVLFPVLNGATIVIDHGAEAVELLDFLTSSRANRLLGTPAFFRTLLLICRNEKRTLAGVKSITIAGGLLTQDVERVYGLMKIAVSHCYGQAENLWTLSMQDTAPDPDADEVGLAREHGAQKPLPGFKYKVVDDNGDEIPGPDFRTGRLAVTTPTVMSGYYKQGVEKKELELATKTVIRGTWLYTGDIAQLEGEGETLRILPLGRQADLLKVDGEYMPLTEATRLLKSIQGVEDAAAFAVKTARNELVVFCAVVRGAGALSDKQILAFCNGKLPSELVPKAVAFTDFIPKDFGGAPNYGKLRAQFSGIAG